VHLEIDAEGAIYPGAGKVAERVLVGGGPEVGGGEEGAGWVVSERKEGAVGADVARGCAWEVTRYLRCEERTRKWSSGLLQTLRSRWQ
jgi:hypothetical protein